MTLNFCKKLTKKDWLLVVIFVVFALLRTYRISQSLYFQNDIGRDYLRLIEWQQSGIPPLLGPQNSALPFNQSAFYFYMFYPLYLITGGSFLTTFLTCLFLHLAIVIAGYLLLRNTKFQKLLPLFLITAWLAAVHPQLISQQRYVWNPSFVFISTSAAFFFFYLLQQEFKAKYLWGFAFSATFAAAMNLSAAPGLIAFLLMTLIKMRKRFWQILTAVFVAGNVWFLPYWAFEVKYNFQIIKRVLGRQMLVLNPHTLKISTKLENLAHFILDAKLSWELLLLSILLSIMAATALKVKLNKELLSKAGRQAFWLGAITFILMMLFPVAIESHYIFSLLSFVLITVAGIKSCGAKKWLKLGLLTLVSVWWLRPSQVKSYFQRAPRTYAQLTECFSKVCQEQTEPIFVSAQAAFHNYHSGPEFRYLMLKQGCQVKHIEFEPQAADKMAVVADQAEYTHGETAYDELTLFGEAELEKVYQCLEDVRVYILAKN